MFIAFGATRNLEKFFLSYPDSNRFFVQIQDKPHHDNLSRYSVPDGLLIIECEDPRTTIVITAQKFAKGTRFGEAGDTTNLGHQKITLSLQAHYLLRSLTCHPLDQTSFRWLFSMKSGTVILFLMNYLMTLRSFSTCAIIISTPAMRTNATG